MSGRARRWALAVTAATVLLGFEFGVARNPGFWIQLSDDRIATLEREVIVPASEARLLVFGDSRSQDGVHEIELAHGLGLQPNQVLKLSAGTARMPDFLYLYQRYRGHLSAARVAVIGVDVWTLTECKPPNPRTLRYHPAPRLTHYPATYWPELLLARCLRSVGAVRPVARIVRSRLMAPGRRSGEQPEDVQLSGVFSERDPGMERLWSSGSWYVTPMSAERMGYGRYEDAATHNDGWHGGQIPALWTARPLYCLLDNLCEDGVQVLVVRWPLVDEYFSDLEARYPEFARAYNEAMVDLRAYAATHPNVEIRDYGRASQWGLDYRAFYDYGHPSPLGREFCTRELEEWAREHLDD